MIRTLPVLVLLAVLAVWLTPGAALAHATFTSSAPAHGAVLSTAPTVVHVHFNEPVTAEFVPLVVRDQTGSQVDLGDAQVVPADRSALRAGLRPLGPGIYTAVYRVTSLDGHPVQGTITFSIGVPLTATITQDKVSEVPASTSLVRAAAQWAMAILAGLGLFLLLVWRRATPQRPSPALVWSLVGLVVLLGLTEVGLYAMRASGESLSLSLFLKGLGKTRTGLLWLTRFGLAALTGLALTVLPQRARWALGALGAVPALLPGAALLLTLSLQSHAFATGDLLPVAVDWVHLAAASAWVGGLAGFGFVALPSLWRLPAAERLQILQTTVPRFSRVATLSVAALVGTGIYAAVLHLPAWTALTETVYGRWLLAKVLLLLPLLALGLYNLVSKGRGAFRHFVWVELALVAAIFVAAGFLSTRPPATVELAAKAPLFLETANVEGWKLTLRIDPNRTGLNQATIMAEAPDGTPETQSAAGLRVHVLTHDMGTQNLDATEAAPGVYQTEPISFGMSGPWEVQVVLLTRKGRELRHPFAVTVQPPM